MADTNAINIGYILEGGTSEDTSQFSASYTQLVDTPSIFPTGGGTYFSQPTASGISFTLLEANKVSYDDSNASITASNVKAALDALDTDIQNNASQLTPNADPTTNTTVANAGAVMDGDFGTDGVLLRSGGSGSYAVLTNGIENLSSGEVTQIGNIDSVTISNAQWVFLGNADQGISTGDDVSFNTVNNLSLSEQSTSFTIAGGSSTTRTLTVDTDLTVSNVMTDIVNDASPQLGGNLDLNGNNTLLDANGNEMVVWNVVVSAVNHFQLSNNSTTNNPILEAIGGDTNIGIDLVTKGSGDLRWNGKALTENQWDSFVTTMDQAVATSNAPDFTNIGLTNGFWSEGNGLTNQINIVTVGNGNTANLSSVASDRTMWVVISERTGANGMATFFCDGNGNITYLINNPAGTWSAALGTSNSQNVDWDGSNFVIENNSGSSQDYMIFIFSNN